jgi:effector-binding domain-containing protein
MAFTMPAEYAIEDLPAPSDQRVSVVPVPARTVAAIRFSGWATGGKVVKMKKRLLATLIEQGVEVTGEPVLNQYNPPWTAPFLRRNEIAVEIKWEQQLAAR